MATVPNSREVQKQGEICPDKDRKGGKDKHKGTEYTAHDTSRLIPLDLLNAHLSIHRSFLISRQLLCQSNRANASDNL